MKPKTLSLIQLNTAVLIWGGTSMFAKGINLPVEHITCFRALISAAVLLVFLVVTKAPIRMKKGADYGGMIALGIFLGLHWLTYFQALKISTAAIAILAMQTYPISTALLEPLVFREKIKRIDIGLAALVFSGVLIMTPEISLSNSTTRGILIGILSGLFFTVRNLLTRKYVHQYPSGTLMFWQALVIGILLLAVLPLVQPATYSAHSIGLLVLLGIFFTAIPHTLYSASFKNLNARTIGILATILPFYGAFFGYLIYDETISSRTMVGGLVVLTGIVIETIRHVKK